MSFSSSHANISLIDRGIVSFSSSFVNKAIHFHISRLILYWLFRISQSSYQSWFLATMIFLYLAKVLFWNSVYEPDAIVPVESRLCNKQEQ